MLRRTLITTNSCLLPAIRHSPQQVMIPFTFRGYSTPTILLEEVNIQMHRVLEEASNREIVPKTTLTQVLRLAKKLRDNKIPFTSETHEHILNAYVKYGTDQDQVLTIHKNMIATAVEPSIAFYNRALLLAVKGGNSTLQAELLHRMKVTGHPNSTQSYHAMFLCMRENLELERALDILDQMKLENIEPSLSSYILVTEMAIRLNEPVIATQVLQQAGKLEILMERTRSVYMATLRCAAFYGYYEGTKTNWETVVVNHKINPDEGTCLYVLNLAGKHGDPKLAGDVIRVLGEQGYTYRECHFFPLIEAFASTGDIENTIKVFNTMRSIGIEPNKKTALPIVKKLGNDKNAIRKAKEMLEKMDDVDILAYNLVLHAFAFNGLYDDAINMFTNAEKFGVKPNTETLDAVLDACIHCKDAELGADLYREQLSEGVEVTVSTLSKMVTLMCTQNDYEDAFIYLKRMKDLKMVPFRGCYYKLVKTLIAANDPRLKTALKDMKKYGYSVSTHMEELIRIEADKLLEEESLISLE